MNTYDYNISDIVNKYSRHVAMLSYTYTKNIADAEDIAQDVFLQLIKSNPSYKCKSASYSFSSNKKTITCNYRVTKYLSSTLIETTTKNISFIPCHFSPFLPCETNRVMILLLRNLC